MSGIGAQALPEIDEVLKQLEMLGAMEAPKIPRDASGDALKHLAGALSDRYVNVVATCQTLAQDLKHARDILGDLQLSKEPDVERLFLELAVQKGTTNQQAWLQAREIVKFRNEKRTERASAPQAAPAYVAEGYRPLGPGR